MAGNFKMPSKKTTIIVGIIIAILAIVALTGTVVFLKDRGSTEAADLGNEQVSRQETETNSETQNEQGAQSSETTQSNGQTTPGGQIQNEGTTPTDNNPSTGTTGNTGTVETTGTTTRTNTTGNAGTTTTDSIQETTITRSELVKSGIDGLYVGWTPMGINAVLASANINAKTDDLAISKSVETKTGENLVTKGEEITYKITVTNNSERELKEVEIKDAIPEKTKYVEGSIDNDGEILKNSKNETVLRWNVNLGTEDENKEKVVSFKVKVEAEEGTIENVAIVNGKTTNKTQTAIIKASKVATIEGKKEKTAKVGDKVTYAITITNTGDIAGKAKVKDETFAKLIVDGILELDETSVSKEMAERLKAGEEMDTEVPAKSNVEIRFKATVLKVSGAIKNIATVGEEKPEETVNTVNITSSKTPSKTEVKVGETFSYTITLNNSGNTAGTVKVKDTAPDGTTFVSAKVNQTNVNISETELAEGYEVTVPGKDGDVDGKVEITLFVKALEKKANNEYTDIVENTATMIDEGKPDQPVPSEDVKVSNIIAEKTSNYEGKAEGKELHELDTITYTIKLTNKGKANGTVKVSDDQPIGTQLIPDSIKVNGQGSYTLENLQKGIDVPVSAKDENNTDGTATLTFQVKVLTFEGTTKDIINDMAKKDNETVNTTTDMAKKLKTEKEAIKEWEDNNDKVGARPESVELELYANGTTTGTKKEASVINNWKVKFEGLNKYDAQGKEITYTVKEVGTVEHYKAETNGLKVTNTIDYTSIKTEKEAVKTWNDDNNKAGVRPEKVELELYANGTATGTKKEANATNNWKVKFEYLNKYDAQGKEITYTVKEVGTVEHYKAETNGLKVTNTIDYTTFKDKVTVTKTWTQEPEDTDVTTIRPATIELQLKSNNNVKYKHTINTATESSYEFEVEKYDANGNAITYEADENADLTNYDKSVNGYTITNAYKYAKLVPTKTAYKDVECTQKVNIENEADNFAPSQRVYYELTVTNKGKVNGSATLTDTLPESLENYRVESGNATINKTTLSWNATDLQPGATQKVIVSGTVKQNAQYVDIGTKQGGTSKVTAKLFVRKDGRIPFEGSNTPYDTKYYTNCVGTVYLNTNTAAAFGNLSDKDIYYLIDRNNDIVSKVQRGISHDELKVALARNKINLADDEVVIWYVNKWEDDGWHIDGAIRKISDLQKVTNTLTMVQNDNKATATVSADIKLKTISSIATTNLLSAVLAKVEDDTINTENVDAISEKVNKKDAEVNETKTVTKTEQTNIPDKKVDSKEQSNIEEKEETTKNDSTNIDNSVEKPEKNEDSTNTNKEININKETENKEEVLNVEQIETTN